MPGYARTVDLAVCSAWSGVILAVLSALGEAWPEVLF
jgi:ABC-type arginine transport system permease subunit